MSKRNADIPDIVDILIQYKNNPRLLKRMHDYVTIINSKITNYNENGEKVMNNDEENDDEDVDITHFTNSLDSRFLEAISIFDDDNKITDYLSNPSIRDSIKKLRTKRIAERTKPMKPEKYKRFSEARSCSFVRSKGKPIESYFKGFRKCVDAPESCDNNMIYLLNFCAVEMVNVLVENAEKIKRKEYGKLAEKMLNAPIQLEHYQQAAKPIIQKRDNPNPPPSKKSRTE